MNFRRDTFQCIANGVNISHLPLDFPKMSGQRSKETSESSILQICFLVNRFCSINVNLSWVLLDYKKLMVRGSVFTCAGRASKLIFFLFFNVCFYLLIGWLICFCFVFPAKQSQEKQMKKIST